MNASLITYSALGIAIVLEVMGTSLLPVTRQFTRLAPTLGMLACYATAFFFLTIALKTLPVGIVYAVWSGLGIVLISLIGHFAFGQRLDAVAVVGLALIVSGVVLVNGFSSAGHH